MNQGTQEIFSVLSVNDVIESNDINCSNTNDEPLKGIKVLGSRNTQILNNTFSNASTTSGINGTQKIQCIELETKYAFVGFSAAIKGNLFTIANKSTTEYNIYIHSVKNTYEMQVDIQDNSFGKATDANDYATVECDILIENCKLVSSSIKNNIHSAFDKITKNYGVKSISAALESTEIGSSYFPTKNTTKSTALEVKYYGIRETILCGSSSSAISSQTITANSSYSTDISITGLVSFPDQGYIPLFTVSTQNSLPIGVILSCNYKENDIATVSLTNITSSSVTVNPGFIVVKAEYGCQTLKSFSE